MTYIDVATCVAMAMLMLVVAIIALVSAEHKYPLHKEITAKCGQVCVIALVVCIIVLACILGFEVVLTRWVGL